MVKCQDCGCLAVRHMETRALVEVENEMRQTGQSPSIPGRPTVLYVRTPICFVMAHNLVNESNGADDSKSFLRVIKAERECSEFTRWKQGSTPKEHKEMVDAERLREWQRRVEKEDRDYRDQQRKSDRRWNLFLIVLAAVLAFVFSLVQARLSPQPRNSDPPETYKR